MYAPYVRELVGLPLWSSTVAAVALNVADPYRCTAASRFRGNPDGTYINREKKKYQQWSNFTMGQLYIIQL